MIEVERLTAIKKCLHDAFVEVNAREALNDDEGDAEILKAALHEVIDRMSVMEAYHVLWSLGSTLSDWLKGSERGLQ